MIGLVLTTVQKKFQDDWLGVVHYGSTQFDRLKHGDPESWINVDVEPINTETLSYAGCAYEEHEVYVTCYHRNQVQAAKLADDVINFIQQKQLGTVYTRTWRPVNQGMMEDGKAFYKLSIPTEIIN